MLMLETLKGSKYLYVMGIDMHIIKRKEAKQRQQDFVLRKTKVLKPKTLAIAIVVFQNK